MKTKAHYLFFTALCTLVFSGALVFYAITGITNKTEIIKTHYQQDFKNKNIELGVKSKREAETLANQQSVIEKVFLKQEEIIPFITQIETLANQQNLTITIDKVDRGAEEVIGETYKTQSIAFNLSVDGSFEQIKYFIDRVTHSDTLVEIKEFKIYKMGVDSNLYNARIIITSTILLL
jgi:hypothetical protein